MQKDFNSNLERKIKELESRVEEKDSLIVCLASEVMELQRTNEQLKEENHGLKMYA